MNDIPDDSEKEGNDIVQHEIELEIQTKANGEDTVNDDNIDDDNENNNSSE